MVLDLVLLFSKGMPPAMVGGPPALMAIGTASAMVV